ncbi:MAG: bifunctional demethylmenaquinone methyltransferase/2-methoxy-6-polyprenyl-1,4-benzoquinol methylase UbiE [Alphaproteobacteria bacterium]|nr:bifunctional demethylmenaquinone methyltransferase/2-methoxy-6-polyprenyl-1,4-benzoquinol methylase UbiE [Alphaproteobacteria bacterium]
MTNTHFGFKTVDEKEKASLVRGVFDSVASRYDIMNDFMSAGLHRMWKHEMVSQLAPRVSGRYLDVAGGTGDIAFRIKKRAKCHVTVCDINAQMLGEGKRRADDQNFIDGIEWVCGDAEKLPLPSDSFDAYTIAFGIRNVTHIGEALKDAFRVLKSGGRFLCLEFSHIPHGGMQKLYDLYSFNVIPKLGKMVAGDADSYQYLVESIRRFPRQEEFAEMIRAAGFDNVQYRNLTHGVVAIHAGRKP